MFVTVMPPCLSRSYLMSSGASAMHSCGICRLLCGVSSIRVRFSETLHRIPWASAALQPSQITPSASKFYPVSCLPQR